MRSVVLHGTVDATVHLGNDPQNGQRQLDQGPRQTLQTEDRGQAGARGYCRTVTTDFAGVVLAQHWEIEGLGHASSGGSLLVVLAPTLRGLPSVPRWCASSLGGGSKENRKGTHHI